MSENATTNNGRTESVQDILQRRCTDLAGRYLTAINGEAVGPWPIEHAAQGSYPGDELLDQQPLDITVWIGGRMVGIQLPRETFPGQSSTIETKLHKD